MPKAIAIRKVDGKPGQVYYPLDLVQLPDPKPQDHEVVVKISAAALNHRDLFLRRHLYPGIAFGVPLLADGSGVVIETGSSPEAQKWKGKRVVLNPGTGWKDDADGPESPKGYAILGGTKMNPLGTLGETVTIDVSELEEAPQHLSSIAAAALPLTGLTAWRATITKSGQAKPGRNLLITGIGGGVALMALLFAVGAGANVYVTSGSEEKIQKAKELGAKGGVNYKEKDWEKKLVEQLPAERKQLDAIIDGAGGDVVEKGMRILRVRHNHQTYPLETLANTRIFRPAASSPSTA
jgi:NADPH:quinone reductase-like Zn-dependent oxidoreductase